MKYRFKAPTKRGRFQSLVILFGLAFLSFSVSASPPNPPVFTALDDQVLGPADGRYSLDDATRGVPFIVNTPIPPTITSEATVTPATIAANKVNGRRLILQAGNYGSQSFGGADMEVILNDGVSISGITFGGAQRIIVRAATPRAANVDYFDYMNGTDILMDGINSNNGTNRNFITGQRVGLINSFVRVLDYAVGAFGGPHNDMIIANNQLESYGSSQAGNRLVSANRLVFVDNRVSKTGSGHNTWRLHADDGDVEYSYTARNQFEGPRLVINAPGGTPTGNENRFRNVWFENNAFYVLPNAVNAIETAANFGQPQSIDTLVLRNNVAFGASSWVRNSSTPGWTVAENTVAEYVPPPPWSFR